MFNSVWIVVDFKFVGIILGALMTSHLSEYDKKAFSNLVFCQWCFKCMMSVLNIYLPTATYTQNQILPETEKIAFKLEFVGDLIKTFLLRTLFQSVSPFASSEGTEWKESFSFKIPWGKNSTRPETFHQFHHLFQ